MNPRIVALAFLLGLAGCGGEAGHGADPEPTARTDQAVAVLEDGAVVPGRYRYTIPRGCGEEDQIACPDGMVSPAPLDLEVTVPAGWRHWKEYGLLTPALGEDPTEGPDGAALVMGWTTFHVGVSSDPCLEESHQAPDVEVGPSVDDFVDAVQAQEALDVTEPVETTVGTHRARFFSLEAPADFSHCFEWRPWDPGFFAQGPSNHWDVWAVDVDGDRVLLVTQHFQGTPERTVADLREMVESIRFLP